MSEETDKAPGTIVWRDLTVDDASGVRDFYESVVGWKTEACEVGDYEDYNMFPADSTEPIAGICHARGINENMPAQWLLYVSVGDVDKSARQAVALGGKILNGPRTMGKNRFCVIQDPAGAVLGLID